MRKLSVRPVFVVTVAALVAAPGVTTCTIGPSGGTVLPNGVTIDEVTKERLVGLTDDYNALLAERLSSARSAAAADASEPVELLAARELLVREFGEAGLDYISGELQNPQIIEAEPDVSARYLVIIGEDSVSVYYMEGLARFSRWPWGSVIWGITKTHKRTKADGDQRIYNAGLIHTRIVDQVTPPPGNEASASNADRVDATGNYRGGFFPQPAFPATTWHDVYDGVLYNGQAHLVLGWTN
jgi:hypothetical protein